MAAISGVRQSLQAEATDDEIEASMTLLMSGMKLSGVVGMNGLAQAYTIALDGTPSVILRQGVKSLLRGEAEGMDKTFMPSAPELLAYLQKLHRDWLAMATMTERMLALPEEPAPPEPMSEDQMARRREQIAALDRPRAVPGEAA